MERQAEGRLIRIAAEEYASFGHLEHLFLVGNLKKPNPHPFVRDSRLEFIVCSYGHGADGLFHWHQDVTEYEVVVEGRVGYTEAATGATTWFRTGDFNVVAPGVCVRRLVPEGARTVAVKVPSSAEKIHCSNCPRECLSRVAPFSGD